MNERGKLFFNSKMWIKDVSLEILPVESNLVILLDSDFKWNF